MLITFIKGGRKTSFLLEKGLTILPQKGDFISIRNFSDNGDIYFHGHLKETHWYFSSGNAGLPNLVFVLENKNNGAN
jgi:hypothetical protein